MIDERAYLLDRCLRLEARLLGVVVDPPSEVAYEVRRARPAQHTVYRKRRNVTPADIAQMRDLRARGLSYHAIAQRVLFAETTVQTYVRDVQVTR